MTPLRTLEGIRVLIVEDDADMREMYALALEFYGAIVESASNANDGFDLVLRWHPDVVVTDFILRGGPTGADLCRRMHEDTRTAHLPVLVVTGSTRKADAEELLGAGCADIRLKPYLPEALVEDILRLTTPKSQRRSA